MLYYFQVLYCAKCKTSYLGHKLLDQYKNPFLQRPRTTTPRMYSGYQPFSFSTNSVSSNEQEYILDEIDDVNDFVPVCAYSDNYGHSIISSNAPSTIQNVTNEEFVLDEPYITLPDEYDLVPQSDGLLWVCALCAVFPDFKILYILAFPYLHLVLHLHLLGGGVLRPHRLTPDAWMALLCFKVNIF